MQDYGKNTQNPYYLKLTAFPLQEWLRNGPQYYVIRKFPVLYFFVISFYQST